MPKQRLADWLERLGGLHPSAIDLGLERVGAVATAMGIAAPRATVITVGGTNGKGSVCAVLEAVLGAAGRRVGLYTSPHLTRFNERIRIDGREADDAAICAAFERIERARGEISLTYFEFGTLAALDLFTAAGVDAIVLEVGLGGRLDATNIVDADVAVVTSVALDHAEWLGRDRDAIAREKAGIARPGRPLILGEQRPTAGLLAAARERGAEVRRAGRDFSWTDGIDGWAWRRGHASAVPLPLPGMGGGYQLDNAATALAALDAVGLDAGHPAVAEGLRRARVPGRFEVITGAGPGAIILDVAHNPAAAEALARSLATTAGSAGGRTLALVAMYDDKDVEGVVAALAPAIDGWFAAGLPAGRRGADVGRLAAAIHAAGGVLAGEPWGDLPAAFEAARAAATPADRLVVAGSFAAVGPVRSRLGEAGRTPPRRS